MDVNESIPADDERPQSIEIVQPSSESAEIKEELPAEKSQTLLTNAAAHEPITPKQLTQTEPMEVHHHAHAPHGKNKWKEYLFQFFMLFLAVFCGFLAEYQLEHVIEHQREKQFMESIMNDVKADINRLGIIINQRLARENRLDSLSHLINRDYANVSTNIIYANAVTASRSLIFRFIPNDGTMQQLKNSGAFRLIRNRTVVDSISRYDVSVR